jgi:toxin CptA
MHDAPSVTCPVGRSHWAGALLLALWLAGLLAALLWSTQTPPADWRSPLVWITVAVAGALALRSWWRAPAGTLAWDGAAWSWRASGAADRAGQLRVSIDLQHAILVRWHDGNERSWFWLERRHGGERWDDVRRAVYSRARPQALPAADPPAAKP